MKSLGFFSSWVLKLHEVNTIDEVYSYKNEDMPRTKSQASFQNSSRLKRLDTKFLLVCIVGVLSNCFLSALPLLTATNAITDGSVQDIHRPFGNKSSF